jgi:hypothetical protein
MEKTIMFFEFNHIKKICFDHDNQEVVVTMNPNNLTKHGQYQQLINIINEKIVATLTIKNKLCFYISSKLNHCHIFTDTCKITKLPTLIENSEDNKVIEFTYTGKFNKAKFIKLLQKSVGTPMDIDDATDTNLSIIKNDYCLIPH